MPILLEMAASERSIVPCNYLQLADRARFGHRLQPALRLSGDRKNPVRGTTKVHYFAGLVAAVGQSRLAFEANQVILAHVDPGNRSRQESPRPRQKEIDAFLTDAVRAGWLTPRPDRTLPHEANRYRQVMDGWLSGERAMSISDQASYEVLRAMWKNLPALPNRQIGTVLHDARASVRANRPAGRPRPREHPDLGVVRYGRDEEAALCSASPASAAPGPYGTGLAMDPAAHNGNGATGGFDEGLTKEELDDLAGAGLEPLWSESDADRIDAAAEEAVESLLAAGPAWLQDGVRPGDRYVAVVVDAPEPGDGPGVSGFAQPFHVFVEIYLGEDYPQTVLVPGWSVIDGRFVIEILRYDEQQRPSLVTVLSLQDTVSIIEPDTGRDGIRFEAVLASVVYDAGRAALRLL